MIDYSKFKSSLRHLILQHENYQNSKHRLDLAVLDQEAIAESCIQRFEICYDCLWKILKRYLIVKLGIPEIPNSPKAVFRLAHENQLLASSIETWLTYADTRTDTAHDYDQNKAGKCLIQLETFIRDAIQLYQSMTGEVWI